MGIISWIVFGLIAGAVAKFVMPGSDRGGFIIVILGILGAMLGGWIGTILGFGSFNGFHVNGFAMAIAGALLVLFLSRISEQLKLKKLFAKLSSL